MISFTFNILIRPFSISSKSGYEQTKAKNGTNNRKSLVLGRMDSVVGTQAHEREMQSDIEDVHLDTQAGHHTH